MTPHTLPPITRFPDGTRVWHGDGAEGVVVRRVAAIPGGALYLIRWDDLSQTRGGDDVHAITQEVS